MIHKLSFKINQTLQFRKLLDSFLDLKLLKMNQKFQILELLPTFVAILIFQHEQKSILGTIVIFLIQHPCNLFEISQTPEEIS